MKKADILIVGQGLAGSILGMELEKAGLKVLIIGSGSGNSASKIGAGLYNPITGRKMVKTWLADQIFPILGNFYDELEELLKAQFHYPMPIYRPFLEVEEQNDWMGRSSQNDFGPFINQVYTKSRNIPRILDPLGGIELKYSGYVDLPVLMKSFEKYYSDKGMLYDQLFDFKAFRIHRDEYTLNGFSADKIIFCTGASNSENPLWNHLKFRLVKGEIIDIELNFEPKLIINRGVFLIPKNGHVTVGSTYDHEHVDWHPTNKGLENIKGRLSAILSAEYRILKHRAGVRPATFDRRPFIGFHPGFQNVGIFNGFGTKGVSLIPYFAKLFVEHIVHGQDLMREVSVER